MNVKYIRDTIGQLKSEQHYDDNGSKIAHVSYTYYKGLLYSVTKLNFVNNKIVSAEIKNPAGIITSTTTYDENQKIDIMKLHDSVTGKVTNIIDFDAGTKKSMTSVDSDGFAVYTYKYDNIKVVETIKHQPKTLQLLTPVEPVQPDVPVEPVKPDVPTEPVVPVENKPNTQLDLGGNTETLVYTKSVTGDIEKVVVYENGIITETLTYKKGKLDTVSIDVKEVANKTDGVGATWHSFTGHGAINVDESLEVILNRKIADTNSDSNDQAYVSYHQFDNANNAGYTGDGVTIAILDTGIDLDNPYITSNIHSKSFNFVNNTTNVQDDHGHGTFLASIIGAKDVSTNNIEGVAQDADLMILKIMGSSGTTSNQKVAQSIIYAVNNGADVLNLSLSGNIPSNDITTALAYARDKGVIAVIASGNNGGDAPMYPAYYAQQFDNVISVGNLQIVGNEYSLRTSSAHAGSVEEYNFVSAIGASIAGYNISNGVTYSTGTSMSTSVVASQVALLIEADREDGNYNYKNVINAITSTTDSVNLLGQYNASQIDLPYFII